jgi:cytochrome c-type biogenesis protein CcmH/NrfF
MKLFLSIVLILVIVTGTWLFYGLNNYQTEQDVPIWFAPVFLILLSSIIVCVAWDSYSTEESTDILKVKNE